MQKSVESVSPCLVRRSFEAWPCFDQDEIDAVVSVLRSGKVNQWTGGKVSEFERSYETHLGRGQAIALANGSLALELALRALGVGPGDEVVVTARSFIASASCVRLVGAMPIFADVDRASGNMDAQSIDAVISRRTKAIIPVHLAGWPADMPSIMELARARNIKVIEDCAQAHGAEIGGQPVGSFGDAAAFSFCQDKIISTGGEGGMAIFHDPDAYAWAWSFKDHGKARDKMNRPRRGAGFKWVHDRIGTNWRMLETSAAIGLVQLRKLQAWRSLRRRNATIWAEGLRHLHGLRLPLPGAGCTGAYYKYYFYLDPRNIRDARSARDRILAEAMGQGIPVFSGTCPEIYLEQAFADLKVAPRTIARELGETSLMIEVHPTLDPHLERARANALASIVEHVLQDCGTF